MHIFHTTSGFKRSNISRNTRWNFNSSLPFKNLPLKFHVIQTHSKSLDKTVSIRSWIFHILAILLRTSQVKNVWVLKLICPGKPALWVWQRNYHVQKVSFTENYWTILRSKLNYTAFQIELYCVPNWTEIIVEIQLIWFWLANVLCLLSDYRKKEIIRSMNLINGFGITSYQIRGIHLPIVLSA